jgi:hypothetical protein
VQVEALKTKAKYCRAIRRDVRFTPRWYVQLEGPTPLRRATRPDEVGLDIGAKRHCCGRGIRSAYEPFRPLVIQPWLSYRLFQRSFGKRTKVRSAGLFVEHA